YTPAALRILKQKKNLRIMLLCNFWTTGRGMDLETKAISGGAVIQTQDTDLTYRGKGELKVVTKVKPTADQIRSMLFAEVAAKHVKSNAIVLVQGTRLVGCGAAQMSRVDSCRLAAAKAGLRAIGAVRGSDAMFPATDGLEAAAETGCAAIIQPGGSIRDKQVIAAANKREVAMVFTGMRHFWH
ncbi:MAG: bifunctional phosphoribosylaminoimidazolecarboxamide formyltransferase/IMP cyclohydrolase, partial [Kiritimatiellaeota bacterium]|nr:bifunctional phosphoribosylaminoimidazolecarboxamide formyltransferase/IMP cyclohydrolase [Kiritimatiellota bacterium]